MVSRLEQLHTAYESKEQYEKNWVFTCDRPPPPRRVLVWIKLNGLDIFGLEWDCRYAEERDLVDVVAWKDI